MILEAFTCMKSNAVSKCTSIGIQKASGWGLGVIGSAIRFVGNHMHNRIIVYVTVKTLYLVLPPAIIRPLSVQLCN